MQPNRSLLNWAVCQRQHGAVIFLWDPFFGVALQENERDNPFFWCSPISRQAQLELPAEVLQTPGKVSSEPSLKEGLLVGFGVKSGPSQKDTGSWHLELSPPMKCDTGIGALSRVPSLGLMKR